MQFNESIVNGGTFLFVQPSQVCFLRLADQVATGALYNSGEQSEPGLCHPGTRESILKELQDWVLAYPYPSPIKWLHSPAGAGKSAIARTMAQWLALRNLLIAAFFFSRADHRRNTTQHFIATIAYQLCRNIPATRPHILAAIEDDPLIFCQSLSYQAQSLIINPCIRVHTDGQLPPDHARIITVDGLDECNDADRQRELLKVLYDIIHQLPFPMALLVASRPEPAICNSFDTGVLNKASSRLMLDDHFGPGKDIRRYFHGIGRYICGIGRYFYGIGRYLYDVGWHVHDKFRSIREGRGVDQPTQGQKTALRRALLIGINWEPPDALVWITPETMGENDNQGVGSHGAVDRQKVLRGPQKDAWDFSQLLIDVYGYDESEITVLINDNIPGHVQPTRDNIIWSMENLVRDATKGDQFFFHFAGLSTQMATDDPSPYEEDGLDECIVTSDEQLLKDDDLNKYLLSPLPAGSSLVAVFDSCHSGTLLDLPHLRCNRVYVPWASKARSLSSPLTMPLSLDSPVVESPVDTRFAEQWQTPYSQPPQFTYCTGWCRDEPPLALQDGGSPVEADVIALSAAKDGERSWEREEGSSMTQALIRILSKNREPSLENLLTLVSHELYQSRLDLYTKSQQYMDKVQIANQQRRQMGRQQRRRVIVERDKFQDPQLSSLQPLDMKRLWKI